MAPRRLALGLAPALLALPLQGGEDGGGLLSFLAARCFPCHGETRQRADLRLDVLARELPDVRAGPWRDVLARLSAGEMPPDGLPDAEAREQAARAAAWLSRRLAEARDEGLAAREEVSFLRLSREEYANTVADLLDVRFAADGPGALIADEPWRGLERIGPALSLSASHLERYLAAAEAVLEEAYPDAPPAIEPVRLSALDLLAGPGGEPLALPPALAARSDEVKVDLWPRQRVEVAPPGPWSEHAGTYRLRVRLAGVRARDGRAPRLVVRASDLDRVLLSAEVVAPEDEPAVVEVEVHLPRGAHAFSLANATSGPSLLARLGRSGARPFFGLAQGHLPWQVVLLDPQGTPLHPVLIVDGLELEGPLPPAHPERRARFVPRLERSLSDPACRAEVGRRLEAFLSLAFRRPPRAGEVEPYAALFLERWRAGEEVPAALRATLAAVLCSADFLYLVEGQAGVEGAAGPGAARLTAWELAARLSYFLWATLPDQELRARAADGSLLAPEVLRAQTRRLLADPRARRFASSFSRQWLQLARVGEFPPDVVLYPDYDEPLEQSLVREPQEFFATVLAEDLSIAELLDSDWTVLDGRLARHYGIAGVEGDGFRRVALAPGDHRGGIPTMAAVLSLTSDGTRHRPVHRGVWLLQTLFGESPPPPPANVDPIAPTPLDAPKRGVRAQLEAHRESPACASCHRRIDPLGLAFDHYDAVGRWREVEHVPTGLGPDPPVDASGVLPDGRAFSGAGELQELLRADLDRFAAALLEKLAAYALRRPPDAADREALRDLVEASARTDHRLAHLVELLVLSDLFARR